MSAVMSTRRATGTVMLILATALAISGCSEDEEVAGVTQQLGIIVDVSASMGDASGGTSPVDGYARRAKSLIKEAPEGTRVVIGVADGASGASPCIPVVVDLLAEGKNDTTKKRALAKAVSQATGAVAAQVACGKKNGQPASDIIGAIMKLDDKLDPDLADCKIVAMSDGLQYAGDFTVTAEIVGDAAKTKESVDGLAGMSLLPKNCDGGTLVISDPGLRSEATAAQLEGLKSFWAAYAEKAGMTFEPSL